MHAVVRYGLLRHLVEVAPDGPLPAVGSGCVLTTFRGAELGRVLAHLDGEATPTTGVRYERAATPHDEERARDLARSAREEDLPRVRDVLARVERSAHAVAAERPLDGERLVVYYSAEGRIDIRELLSELQAAMGDEVLLEQLGARQRARACGGAGVCGQSLCCSTFLRRMEPVTMRMARVQGLALKPEVTAGACGRLKCCLRYENPLYEEYHQGLPREGWRVESRRGGGTVVAVDVLRRRVRVRPESGPPLTLFADELLRSGPAPRTPLPLAGQPPAPPPDEDDSSEERGWSGLARRLWRRVTPRPPGPPPED